MLHRYFGENNVEDFWKKLSEMSVDSGVTALEGCVYEISM